jgi:predicted ATPase/DNA-binding SARP family transcriptional activator/Flp pilus assembly protein TadD
LVRFESEILESRKTILKMAELQLHFLGPGRVVHTQKGEIEFRGRLLLALLAYLAVESDQSHSRETLMGLLWPELPEADARNNLRVTWSRLRTRLGASAGPPFLTGTRFDLRFNPDSSHWLDVAEFQALIAAAKGHAHGERHACPDCCRKLDRAAELYRGAFLAGFYLDGCPAFEEWQFVQRERLHLQTLDLLAELVHCHEGRGELKAAEGYARRQLELDPLREDAHRGLMRLLSRQGQRGAALAQYQVCRRVLRDELGVEPDAETLLLYQQLKSGALLEPAPGSPSAGLAPTTHNLPESVTPFFGREEELAQIGERLRAGAYRLLSIVGPGGIGKTRLALQAARENLHLFSDGAYFVPLAPVQTASEVPTAIAAALGLSFSQAPSSPRQQLLTVLRHKNALLVLDNLEHLLHDEDLAAQVVDLLLDILHLAPGISLLATSRQRLDLQAEDLYRLRGLPVPGPDELAQASHFASVRLFCDRAYRIHKSFKLTDDNLPHVVRICALVEGMPLGLEVAATWMRDLEPANLAAALENSLDMLETTMRDVPPQHRSIRAVFDHSWRLLAASEQDVLRQLGVFRGGFSMEAAADVAGATPIILTRLRYKSLIRGAGGGRYDMHQLLWRFAVEKLCDEPELEYGARRRHSDYFLSYVGSRTQALHGEEPRATLAEIGADLENVRQAWGWAVETGRFVALRESQAISGLARFYSMRGLYAEGERVFEEAVRVLETLESSDTPTDLAAGQLRLELLAELTDALIRQSKLSPAIARAREATRLAASLQENYGQARAYQLWGYACAQHGDVESARGHLEAGLSLARQGGHLALEGEILRHLGNVFIDLGQRAQGDECLEQALDIHRRLGDRAQEQAVLLYLGVARLEQNDYPAGRDYLEAALRLVQPTGDRALEARIENALGYALAALGDLEGAPTHHQRSRHISRQIGDPFQESHALHNLCTVNRKLGRLENAEASGREALRLAVEHHLLDPEAYAWLHLGYVLLDTDRRPAAGDAFAHSRDAWTSLGRTSLAVEASAGLAEAAFREGDLAQAMHNVEIVLHHMAQDTLDGTDEPFQIYLTCYRVLKAHGDARAGPLLDEAHDLLCTRAGFLTEEGDQVAFLHNVPAHRELMALWGEGG